MAYYYNREQSNEELKEDLVVQVQTLSQLRRTHAITPLENPNVLSASKKTIARIKTELRRRELEAAKAQ